jgi:CRP/FNR family transcriptional regulator, anaerobic regulatory protein
MLEVLYNYLSERMPLTREQFDEVQELFIPKKLGRGEILLREGEVAKYGCFVSRGCLRSYVVDNKGKEHVVQFAPENWWLSDLESLLHKKPTVYFMDAIEPSEVLLIDPASFQKMMDKLPGLAQSFQAGQQRHNAAKDKRIIATLTSDAEERYRQFLNTYPTIAQRVPQHMLASYLGITAETLSRVRKKWSLK